MSGNYGSARNVTNDPAGNEGSESLLLNDSEHVRHVLQSLHGITGAELLQKMIEHTLAKMNRRQLAAARQHQFDSLAAKRIASEQKAQSELENAAEMQAWMCTIEVLESSKTRGIVPPHIGRALDLPEMWWTR